MFTVWKDEGWEIVQKNPHWESAAVKTETFCTECQYHTHGSAGAHAKQQMQ